MHASHPPTHPPTHSQGCPIKWNSCWAWGLTIAQYYYLLFVLVLLCVLPLLYFQEVEDKSPHRTAKQFALDLFDTCRYVHPPTHPPTSLPTR